MSPRRHAGPRSGIQVFWPHGSAAFLNNKSGDVGWIPGQARDDAVGARDDGAGARDDGVQDSRTSLSITAPLSPIDKHQTKHDTCHGHIKGTY
jgi:hypothetical protein